MKILILGGTGAMGTPLVNILSNDNSKEVYVTSRSKRDDFKNIHYLVGNAKEDIFLDELLKNKWDVIIDFMIYNSNEFSSKIDKLLTNCNQYFFLSSSRCYADSKDLITESSDRLIDVCKDEEYINLDEYGYAKGREENILMNSKYNNYTIIRPYITYNTYRLQLGVYEKDSWLQRALRGKSIVFPKDIASHYTSLTYGEDVAKNMVSLIGNPKALGEAFHIVSEEHHTWDEILHFYVDTIYELTGKKIKIKYLEDSTPLYEIGNKWQIKYDRLYDRKFSNKKIKSITENVEYTKTFDGLRKSLEEFIKNPKYLYENWSYEGWADRIAHEFTNPFKIPGLKNKLRYLKHRFVGKKNLASPTKSGGG